MRKSPSSSSAFFGDMSMASGANIISSYLSVMLLIMKMKMMLKKILLEDTGLRAILAVGRSI